MFLAGAAGAFVFAFIRPDRKSFWRSAGTLSIGSMASFWLTPFVCAWRDWTDKHEIHATAFAIGLIGFLACKTVVHATEQEGAAALGKMLIRAGKRAIGWPEQLVVRDDKGEQKENDDSKDALPGPPSSGD
jgi:hypothetical protein